MWRDIYTDMQLDKTERVGIEKKGTGPDTQDGTKKK